MAQKTQITLQTLVEDCAEARALALRTEQPSAAIQATQLQAKLLGMLVERKESGAPGAFQGQKTAAEIVEMIRAEHGDALANAISAALRPADAVPTPDPTHDAPDSLN